MSYNKAKIHEMNQHINHNCNTNNNNSNEVLLPEDNTYKVEQFASNNTTKQEQSMNDDDTNNIILKNSNDADTVLHGTTTNTASTGDIKLVGVVDATSNGNDNRMEKMMAQNKDPSIYDTAILIPSHDNTSHDYYNLFSKMIHSDSIKSSSTTSSIANDITTTANISGILPRLVDRNLPFYQSKNCIQIDNCFDTMKDVNYNYNFSPNNNDNNDNISNIQDSNVKILMLTRYNLWKLLLSDWFHISLRLQWFVCVPILLMIWTIMIIIWAGIYVWIDNRTPHVSCGLGPEGDPIRFHGAFAFSLETCTTVGYGLPSSANSFFENCPELQMTIYFQMIWSMLFNAFLISFFYVKSAQCDSRAVQVIFSNHAIISIVNISEDNPNNVNDNNKNHTRVQSQQVRFQIRVYDIDSRSNIIESHVRVYAVMKNRPVPRQLRLVQPDDEFNAMLVLSFPTTVSHHIDLYSILHPPPPPYLPLSLQSPPSKQMPYTNIQSLSSDHTDKIGRAQQKQLLQQQELLPYLSSCDGLSALRQVDSLTGNRDEVMCPICGESYGDVERWILHVERYQLEEKMGGYPIPYTHRALLAPSLASSNTITSSNDRISKASEASKNTTTPTTTTTATTKKSTKRKKKRTIPTTTEPRPNNDINELNNDSVIEYARTYLQPTLNIESIRQYFFDNISEIIVVVEGIEPTSSGTFAAIQSYQYNDIVFHPNASFQSCVSFENEMITTIASGSTNRNKKNKDQSFMMVDLDCFHNIDYKET